VEVREIIKDAGTAVNQQHILTASIQFKSDMSLKLTVLLSNGESRKIATENGSGDERRTSAYPSHTAPLDAKLLQRALQTIRDFRCIDAKKKHFGELRTSIYPSNAAPIGAKLRQRAFWKIPNFRHFDAKM